MMFSLWVSEEEHDTKQGERSLADYYVELKATWQEIVFYEDLKLIRPDAMKYKFKIDKLRVSSFLAGLNQEYDQIGSLILGRIPFPTLMQAYAAVLEWESSRHVMVNNYQQVRTAMVSVL